MWGEKERHVYFNIRKQHAQKPEENENTDMWILALEYNGGMGVSLG